MRTVELDRRLSLAEESGTGHNRWHPSITPVLKDWQGLALIRYRQPSA